MNSFSFNRFGKTLRWVLAVNFRTLLMWFIGIALAVFVGEMLYVKMNDLGSPYVLIRNCAGIGLVLFCIFALVIASTYLLPYNDKRRRETFLMLPASNLEKYLALMLCSVVIYNVGVFLALAAGDALRMLWFWISGPFSQIEKESYFTPGEPVNTYYWWTSTAPYLLEGMLPTNFVGIFKSWRIDDIVYTIVSLSVILWTHSLFTLGGTLFRKYSFVLSGMLWIACGISFVTTMMNLEIQVPFSSVWENDHYMGQQANPLGYVLAVALPLLTCFNYWASFHIFKGFQLITNKWTNYDILKR